MVLFFRASSTVYYAVEVAHIPSSDEIQKLGWLFGNTYPEKAKRITGHFVAPHKEIVSPWSTNAVEIVNAMAIQGITRIEKLTVFNKQKDVYDPMLQKVYNRLDQHLFYLDKSPSSIRKVKNIRSYSAKEGLSLSEAEIRHLETVSTSLGRTLTDSEVFGFSQINSEHCRHKIFNGKFIIDNQPKKNTLFKLIRKTTEANPNYVISAYSDNVAFIKGPEIIQFAPSKPNQSSYFKIQKVRSVLSLKAETHNFPVTVEPFNGAATGSGGEIRDRLAGGKGAIPLAGTAVYMTAYPRLDPKRRWEKKWPERPWQYQTPAEILIKASDGASDFGNKFGQPLICGSVFTFEHFENLKNYGFDKAVMLAGGVGLTKAQDSHKEPLRTGDKIVLMGGDNYRIGMGGGSVSSVCAGEFKTELERKAIQRANPEMQKSVMNVIRSLVEMNHNPIRSIHDHGAGGHLNCFAELLEKKGGTIELDKLPKGDITLSEKELLSNESQERMGMVVAKKDINIIQEIAQRERAPMYIVGTVTGDKRFCCRSLEKKTIPVNLGINDLFNCLPQTVIHDTTKNDTLQPIQYQTAKWQKYLNDVLQLESVACKDWLTNKVDRSVTGRVALQQTCGTVQLPLNNTGIIALDFQGRRGIATAIGHAPSVALIDPMAGSRMAIARALTNIVWAPLTHGLKGISLSANWMWAAKRPGEGVRLYQAVYAASEFSQQLGINIPTGKDSLSMTQKYPRNKTTQNVETTIDAPGTVIISAMAEVNDVRCAISPCLASSDTSILLYVPFSQEGFPLGGGSLGQVLNQIGKSVPTVADGHYFSKAFDAIQKLVQEGLVMAGHDVSAGGLITTLLEMCFPSPGLGIALDIKKMNGDKVQILFSETPGVVIQIKDKEKTISALHKKKIDFIPLGRVIKKRMIRLKSTKGIEILPINKYRDLWFKTSFLFDQLQRPKTYAKKRQQKYASQPLRYTFPKNFDGRLATYHKLSIGKKSTNIKAAVIREKGVNGDRELSYALHLAGFDVKDVHMTDLVSGRETLSKIHCIAFAGGFSYSDVLGSAKGWAGSFIHNTKAKAALNRFYTREDTLSLGICNGCQLMMEMGLIYPEWKKHPVMHKNVTDKFESAFVNITIPKTNSVMLKTLIKTRLGVWVAHREGRFILPKNTSQYQIAAAYSYAEYPGNPNGSKHAAAALVSMDGRHLAIMPHIERSLFPWNWAYYPEHRQQEEISPWVEAFVNAYNWIKTHQDT